MRDVKLVLEDGSIFDGKGFGKIGDTAGELVFNTGMTGYQEIITDPSYRRQIVIMTYPLIGNYGINTDDFESGEPQVKGMIIKELCQQPENWRLEKNLDTYFKEMGITGITEIDTRALTRKIRQKGTMKGLITAVTDNEEELVKKAEEIPPISGQDLVKEVTTGDSYTLNQDGEYHAVVIDCGSKRNIIRLLKEKNCKVTVVSATTTADEILAIRPDGVLISNGPGDPVDAAYVVNTVKKLIDKLPLFGICLGHQIIALACGAKTFKLKFGHRGANHPVKDLCKDRVFITSQNHGYAVEEESLINLDLEITHININDQTIEGLRHNKLPVFSVQYHPEASPGPEDSRYLFEDFINVMRGN